MPPKSRSRLRSEIHRKILLFFSENQGSVDTPRGLAVWTDENIKKVTEALEELEAVGLLKAHRTSSTVGYSCNLNKKELRSLVS